MKSKSRFTNDDFALMLEALQMLRADHCIESENDELEADIAKLEHKIFQWWKPKPEIQDADDDRIAGYDLVTGEPVYR